MKKINIIRIVPLFALILLMKPLLAGSFQIRDQNPLSLIHGIPLQGETTVSDDFLWTSDVTFTVSNTYNLQENDSELLIIDGETSVLDIVVFRRTSEKSRFGLHIPLIEHSKGGLDNFIINYHDALGLPQGDRESVASHQLLFQYNRDGVTYLDTDEKHSGLGDIRLLADYDLKNTQHFAVTAHAGVKIPSGDSDKLTGSGAVDLTGWLSGDYHWNRRWHSSWQAGLLWMGDGDVLAQQQKSFAGFLGGSLAWDFTSSIRLQIQTDWHSALYDQSDLRLLGPSLTLTTGGRINMGRYGDLALAVMEDIDVGAAPDFQLHIGWQQKY